MPTAERYDEIIASRELINKPFTAANQATGWTPIAGHFVFAARIDGTLTLSLECCYGDPTTDPIITRTSLTASGYNALFEPGIGSCVPVYRVKCSAYTSGNAKACLGVGRASY